MNKYFIIDFDSTFIKTETLEELAEIALNKHQKKDQILKKIKDITKKGMEGTMSFEESLARRIALIKIHKKDIAKLSQVLIQKVSDSIKRNKFFFKEYKNNIYIVSGAFRELMMSLAERFHVDKSHVFANNFIFNKKGYVKSIDKTNPLAHKNGKVEAVKRLHLKGEIIVIGDGYTDYQIKELGIAHKFIAFTENIKRDIVMKKADHIVANFDMFINMVEHRKIL